MRTSLPRPGDGLEFAPNQVVRIFIFTLILSCPCVYAVECATELASARSYAHDQHRQALVFLESRLGTAEQNLHVLNALEHALKSMPLVVRVTSMDYSSRTLSLKNFLGQGGTKTFYQLNSGDALAVPNFVDRNWMKTEWLRIVLEELEHTAYGAAAGIPAPAIRPVTISFEHGNETFHWPTYTSPGFRSIADQGAAVVDAKGGRQTWPANFAFLPADRDAADPAQWTEALRPLLADVRTLARFGIEISRDSGNLIAIPPGHVWHSGSNTFIEIRAYLFDLADKKTATALPMASKPWQSAEATLSIYLNEILFFDLRNREGGSKIYGTPPALLERFEAYFIPLLKP